MTTVTIYSPKGINSVGNPRPSLFAAETLMLTSSNSDGHTVAAETLYSQILSLQLLLTLAGMNGLSELASDEM
jgi:hypothetical protein